MNITVQFLRLPGTDPAVPLPAYATAGAAGADIRASLPPDQRKNGITLLPLARALVPTGLACAIPDGAEMQVRARSGLAFKHGIALVNAPGTIDSDYRGEICVILVNLSDVSFTITHGMRIAQIVIAPVIQAEFLQCDHLPDTARAAGGFGSTGTR